MNQNRTPKRTMNIVPALLAVGLLALSAPVQADPINQIVTGILEEGECAVNGECAPTPCEVACDLCEVACDAVIGVLDVLDPYTEDRDRDGYPDWIERTLCGGDYQASSKTQTRSVVTVQVEVEVQASVYCGF